MSNSNDDSSGSAPGDRRGRGGDAKASTTSPRLRRLAAIAASLAAHHAAAANPGLTIVPTPGSAQHGVTAPSANATMPTLTPPFGPSALPSRRVWVYDPPPPPSDGGVGDDGGYCDAHSRSGTDHH